MKRRKVHSYFIAIKEIKEHPNFKKILESLETEGFELEEVEITKEKLGDFNFLKKYMRQINFLEAGRKFKESGFENGYSYFLIFEI
ncbi:MAG: hypothetical protein Q7U36_03740 [bacterium]|nr:hypothetical protein [bacterium]